MGRKPCCDKQAVKKGPWSPEEDKILIDYINKNGHGTWSTLPKNAGIFKFQSIFIPRLALCLLVLTLCKEFSVLESCSRGLIH